MAWRRTARPAGPVIADPFAVVPLRPEDVEARSDSRGNLHLRRVARLEGLRRRVAGLLGYDYSRRIELDEHGTLYYGLVDGTRSLRAIADRMVAVSGRDRKAVEDGVIVFTKKLMTLDMLQLKVPTAESAREVSGGGCRAPARAGRRPPKPATRNLEP